MVASSDKQYLYVIGNYHYVVGHRHEIYKFSCNGNINDCEWAKIETELAYGRFHFVAFPIPNAFVYKVCKGMKIQGAQSTIRKKVTAMAGNFTF